MESYEYLYAASTVIYIITSIIVVIASILLHNKVKSTPTILVLIGSISALIFNLGDIFLSLIAGRYDVETFIQINATANIVSGLAYGLFCVGLLLFVVNDLKIGESDTKSLN